MPKISAIIPCYNEDMSIGSVIENIKEYCPECDIYVFDNNSTDNSYSIAKSYGVTVKKTYYQGKGEVVRQAFAEVDSDIYILIDADGECDASAIPTLIETLIHKKLDMITIVRDKGIYRKGHSFGNKIFTKIVQLLFGNHFSDMLSGYRVFTKAFVKSFPAHSSKFEIEAELTIYALKMRLPIGEVSAQYKSRPEGSFSKLNTFRDGFKILSFIIYLFITERPILFWWTLALIFGLIGFYYAIPLIFIFMNGDIVSTATSVLSIGFILLSGIFIITGLILSFLQRIIMENRRFQYLNIKNRNI